MLTLEEIKRRLKDSDSELLETTGIKVIGIFGSYARGEATEQSDLDLLISVEEARGFENLHAWDLLVQKLGLKVDLVSEKYLKPRPKNLIMSDVIYV